MLVILLVVTEGVEVHVRFRPASFQRILSDHEASQLVGAREANSARAGITLGNYGDVWRHDALTLNLPSSIFLGATPRQILLFHLISDVKIPHLHRL